MRHMGSQYPIAIGTADHVRAEGQAAEVAAGAGVAVDAAATDAEDMAMADMAEAGASLKP
jgi:hypothetical protein